MTKVGWGSKKGECLPVKHWRWQKMAHQKKKWDVLKKHISAQVSIDVVPGDSRGGKSETE